MPQVGAWIATTLAAGGLKAAALQIGLSMAFNVAASKLLAPKGPKPRDLQTTIRSGNADRYQHFGRVRVGGALMFADWAQVSNRRRAFVLMAVSTGGVMGVDQWYLGGKPVEVNEAGWVQTAPFRNRVRLRLRTGRGDEYAGGDWTSLRSVFPERWTAAHRLDGVATVLAEFDHVDPEEVFDVYPGGSPPDVTAVLRGAPVLGHDGVALNFDTNIPRQLRTYLVSSGVSFDDLDAPSWSAAIADADEAMPTQGGTRPRYHGGGSYGLAEPVKDVVARMLDACAGQLYLTQAGQLGMRVGKYRAPTLVIDASKIVASEIGPGRDELDQVTTLVPEYVEPDLDYTETTADPWEDARAIARFGEGKPRELSLPWVQHFGQARSVAKIHAAAINPRVSARLSLRFWGLRLLGKENVFLHRPELGLDMVPMRITGLRLDLGASDGPIKLELESIDPASLAGTAAQEGQKPASPARPSHAPEHIAAPVILNLRVAQDRTSALDIIGAGPVYLTGRVAPLPGLVTVVQYRVTGGEWQTATVTQESGVFRTNALTDGETYDLRARRIRSGLSAILSGTLPIIEADPSRYGLWTEVTGIVVIANTTPPAAPELVSATASGSALTTTFRPDLGINYARTGLYRGTTWASRTLVQWSWSKDSEITIRTALTGSAQNYWLVSENTSGVQSTATPVGNF